MSEDYYSLLGVFPEATEADIRSAYRKVALKYHPDKNPTEEAAKKFHDLSVALETLTVPSSRAEYDRIRNAQLEKQRRTEALDNERRKLKEDLETREKQAEKASAKARDQKRKVEELKMEGYKKRKLYQDQQDKKLADVTKLLEKTESLYTEQDRTVKIKWSTKNGGDMIKEDDIKDVLSFSYGKVEYVVMSPAKGEKKQPSATALVVFKSVSSAYSFVKSEIDRDQDLFYSVLKSVKWASGKEPEIPASLEVNNTDIGKKEASPLHDSVDRTSDDYMNITLMRLQQSKN